MKSCALLPLAALAALAVMITGCRNPGPGKTEKPRIEIKSRNLIMGDSGAETEISSLTQGTWGRTPSLEWDASTAFEGRRSVKILRYLGCPNAKWYFPPGSASVDDIKNLKFGQSYTFSFYARSDRDGTKAFISAAQFRWKQWFDKKEIILGKEWKRYSLTIVPERKFELADDNRYVLSYGLNEDGIAWFDAFQFEAGTVATEYHNSTPAAVGVVARTKDKNTFRADEKCVVDINVYKARADSPDTITLGYTIQDYAGRTVEEKTIKAGFNADGFWTHAIKLNPKKLGWFLVTAELGAEGKTIAKAASTLVVVAPPVEIAEGLEPFCGCSASGAYRFFLAPLNKIGAKWQEQIFLWAEIEATNGFYNWNARDMAGDALKEAHKQGFKMKVAFENFPAWSLDPLEKEEAEKLGAGHSKRLFCAEAHLGDWRKFVREFVANYKDSVDIYEIGGEVDAKYGLNPYYQKKYKDAMIERFAGGRTLDVFAGIVKAGAEEIRAQVPNAEIGAVRPCDVDCSSYNYTFPYTSEIIKRCGSNDFNVLPLDAYARPRYIGAEGPVGGEPLALRNVYEGAAKAVKKYGNHQKKIYISEYGYALDHREIHNFQYTGEQVRCLVRSFLVARAVGYSSFFWFSVDSDPNALPANYYYYGMWYKDEPLPEVAAFSAVAQIVENVAEAKLLDLNSNVKAAVFRKADGQAVAAVWAIEAPSGIYLGEGLACRDVMGNAITPETRKGRDYLVLDGFPVYLWKSGRGDNFTALADMIGKADMEIKSSAAISFRADDDKIGKLELVGLVTNQPYSGRINYRVDGRSGTTQFNIPPAGKYVADIDISGKNAPGRVFDAEISCGGESGKQKVLFEIPEFIYVPRLMSSAQPDADPVKWGVAPVMVMDNDAFLFPYDPHTPWSGADDLNVKVYLTWGGEYLYLAAMVQDDIHCAREKAQLNNADSILFAFDPRNDASLMKADGYMQDDIEIGMGLTPSVPAIDGYPARRASIWEKAEYTVTRDEQTRTTTYRARFALSELGLVPGKAFGFNAVVFDDDTGSGQSYLMQFTRGIAEGKNPKMFRKFILK